MEPAIGCAAALQGWRVGALLERRNGKWHPYEEEFEPTSDLSAALAEIDGDPTAIFWG